MTDQPPTAAPTPSPAPGHRSKRSLRPVALLASAIAVALVYALKRWATEPTLPVLGVVAVAGAVLLVTGGRASRHGSVRGYVALALLLPCALLVAVTSASDHRESDELAAQAEKRRAARRAPVPRETPLVGIELGRPLETTRSSVRVSVLHLPGEMGRAMGFDVTVTGATCEPSEIARHISTQPPSGERLCLVTSTWQNTTVDPWPLPVHHAFEEVELADGSLRTLTHAERAWSFAATARTGRPTDELLPGQEVELRTVVAVPEGVLPDRLVAHGSEYSDVDAAFFLPLDEE